MLRLTHFGVPIGLILVVGCGSSDLIGLNIPANAIIYEIVGKRLTYDYVDTTQSGNPYILHLLSDTTYTGFNCIGLVPRSSVDTTGTFVFRYQGTNTGLLRQTRNGTTDTTTFYFLPPINYDQGTHGNYALDSSGRLKLFWADGFQSRYFDPSAIIRLHSDTITSDVTFKANGDSVKITWQANWVREPTCE